MKRKDIISLVTTAVIAGIISLLIAGVIFKTPSSRHDQVPQAPSVPSGFPDVANDPAYQTFLNTGALDPALPVQIGTGRNAAPFNSR